MVPEKGFLSFTTGGDTTAKGLSRIQNEVRGIAEWRSNWAIDEQQPPDENRAVPDDVRVPAVLFRRYCTAIGIERPQCPLCGVELPKIPERMIACKNCKGRITGRSRPLDGTKVVVTETEAHVLLAQGRVISEWRRICSDLGDVVESRLVKYPLWETDPHTVLRAYVMNQIQDHLESHEWGCYFCDLLALAEIVRHGDGIAAAIPEYCRAAYVSMNGPTNFGKNSKRGEFRASERDLPPAIVERLAEYLSCRGSSEAALQSAFAAAGNAFRSIASPPLAVETCWSKLIRAVRAKSREMATGADDH